jgi:hypothetical protein
MTPSKAIQFNRKILSPQSGRAEGMDNYGRSGVSQSRNPDASNSLILPTQPERLREDPSGDLFAFAYLFELG